MDTFRDGSQVVWRPVLVSDRKELERSQPVATKWIKVFLEKPVVTCLRKKSVVPESTLLCLQVSDSEHDVCSR